MTLQDQLNVICKLKAVQGVLTALSQQEDFGGLTAVFDCGAKWLNEVTTIIVKDVLSDYSEKETDD